MLRNALAEFSNTSRTPIQLQCQGRPCHENHRAYKKRKKKERGHCNYNVQRNYFDIVFDIFITDFKLLKNHTFGFCLFIPISS